MKSYPLPKRPWERIGTDIATFKNKDYLICYDAYSNWIELLHLPSKNIEVIILKLKNIFARFGVPDSVVSDNNPFNSSKYKTFAEEWGFKPIFTSPNYPQANGLSEKGVAVAKSILSRCENNVEYGLLMYRNTPLASGYTPSQLLNGRIMKSKVPASESLLSPKIPDQKVVQDSLEKSQTMQAYYYNRGASDLPDIPTGESVMYKDNLNQNQWKTGKVVGKGPNPRSYFVQNEHAKTYLRNRRFLRTPTRYRN